MSLTREGGEWKGRMGRKGRVGKEERKEREEGKFEK